MAQDQEPLPFAVARVGGNYVINDQTDFLVRSAIYGKHWQHFNSVDGFYQRTMTALWNKLPVVAQSGIAVDDREGWTRPHLHILLDLQIAVMNTPTYAALRFLQAVYGDDAQAMLMLFAASCVTVANHPMSKSELDFITRGLTGRFVDARHPSLQDQHHE